MHILRKRKRRFLQISQSSFDLYDFSEQNAVKKYILATGILNHIWHNWNYFWRSYWLTYIIGGKDLQNRRIMSPIHANYCESQALYYLLTLIGKRRKNSQGNITESYQEATWGDYQILQDLASELSQKNPDISRVLSGFSLFGESVKHFQTIRNAQVHISSSNMNKIIDRVIPYYIIGPSIKYPHEILEARKLISNRPALKDWIDDMNQFLHEL